MYHAQTFLARLRGLCGLQETAVLYIPCCRTVHTLGMKYPIDVYFLDGSMNVLKRISELRPWRVVRFRRAQHVLEIPSRMNMEDKLNIEAMILNKDLTNHLTEI